MKKSTLFWLICFGLTATLATIKWLVPLFIEYREIRIAGYVILGIFGIIYIVRCIVNEYDTTYILDRDKRFQKWNFIHLINTLIDKTIPSLINKNKKQ